MITVNNRESFLKALDKLLPLNSIGAEIGVLTGDFSEQILNIVQPERLLLIDPYQKSVKSYNAGLGYLPLAYSTDADFEMVCNRFRNKTENGSVTIIRDFSYDAVRSFTDEYFDFIYHDASHLYEDLKKDLSDWFPKLKPGGIMAGHDYIRFEEFGVIRAVNEFCKRYNFEMIIFNENGGDYALRAIQ